MGHIFTTKYIRDERELGEKAEKSTRSDPTCLKSAFLPESKKARCTYPKKVERHLITTKTVDVRRAFMVHSSQTSYNV